MTSKPRLSAWAILAELEPHLWDVVMLADEVSAVTASDVERERFMDAVAAIKAIVTESHKHRR